MLALHPCFVSHFISLSYLSNGLRIKSKGCKRLQCPLSKWRSSYLFPKSDISKLLTSHCQILSWKINSECDIHLCSVPYVLFFSIIIAFITFYWNKVQLKPHAKQKILIFRDKIFFGFLGKQRDILQFTKMSIWTIYSDIM